jgi:hypothetical protein
VKGTQKSDAAAARPNDRKSEKIFGKPRLAKYGKHALLWGRKNKPEVDLA